MQKEDLEKAVKIIKDENVKGYCKGCILEMVQDYFSNEINFKDWLGNCLAKNTKSSVELEEEHINLRINTVYNNVVKMINDYHIEREKIQEIKKLRNKENISEDDLKDFFSNLKLNNDYTVNLTDKIGEVSLIAKLIENKNIRNEYLFQDEDIHHLFNIRRMSEILIVLRKLEVEDENLSENLIKNDFGFHSPFTAHEIKCIFAIKKKDKRKIEEIYLNLKRYAKLREYFKYNNEKEVNDFLLEVCNSDNFCNLSVNELADYLETFLLYLEDEGRYVLEESYNHIKVATNCNITEYFDNKDEQISLNIGLPFNILNRCINGFRKGQLLGVGMLSNAGKTRFLISIVVYLIFVAKQKVLLILNETTAEDFFMCLVTTVLNNTDLKNTHKLSSKKEKEIRTMRMLNKQIDKDFSSFLFDVQENIDKNLLLHITDNYTNEDLASMILKSYYEKGTDYVFYDTMKVTLNSTDTTDDLKKTATLLSEIAKKHKLFIACSFQLTDDTIKTAPELINRLNIANSKQIYHVMDTVILFKEIDKKDYSKYAFVRYKEIQPQSLELDKRYYACVLNKNRVGEKPTLIFEVDLDLNVWKELGKLLKR